MTVSPQKPARKLSMKQRYSALTHDLDWTPTYVTEEEIFPFTTFEGIKVHDWSKWEDPFRLTVEAVTDLAAAVDARVDVGAVANVEANAAALAAEFGALGLTVPGGK